MIQITFVIFIWILPIILMIFTYRKMDEEGKTAFKNDFKRLDALIATSLIVFGLLISLTGFILSLSYLQHMGLVMVFISWLLTSVVSWRKGKTSLKESMSLAYLGVLVMAVYTYFFII